MYSFEDFLNLPLNDLYLAKNGEYKPEPETKPIPLPEPQSESKPDVNIPSER